MHTHFSQPFTGGLDCWFLIGFAACTCLIPVLLPSMFSSLSELIKICPVSTCCQRDTTVWLILTHNYTCHNRCFSIGYHGSPVSKATLECWACSTTPFRKEPHVNKAGMCGTVCTVWVVNSVATATWPLGLHVSLLLFRTWYIWNSKREDTNQFMAAVYLLVCCNLIRKSSEWATSMTAVSVASHSLPTYVMDRMSTLLSCPLFTCVGQQRFPKSRKILLWVALSSFDFI